LSGPATLNGNSVTITGVGPVTLAADQPGDGTYAAATEVTTSFLVSPANQTITPFTKIPTQVDGEAPFDITLPTASSGLTTNVFVHSGPATINGTTVTITGPGTVVLAAVQPGDADYNPSAVVTTSFLVKAMQTLNFPAIGTQTFGEAPFVISPPTSSAGLPVRVTVLSGPARIYGNKVTLTGTGTVVLAANQAGTATVAPAAEVTTSFQVQ
jgi:hypothetical protein